MMLDFGKGYVEESLAAGVFAMFFTMYTLYVTWFWKIYPNVTIDTSNVYDKS